MCLNPSVESAFFRSQTLHGSVYQNHASTVQPEKQLCGHRPPKLATLRIKLKLPIELRSHAPSSRAHGTYEIEKYEWVLMERKSLFSGPFICPGLHMLFIIIYLCYLSFKSTNNMCNPGHIKTWTRKQLLSLH